MSQTSWFTVSVAVMTDGDEPADREEVFAALRDVVMSHSVETNNGRVWSVYAFGLDES